MAHPTAKLAGRSFGYWTVLSQEPGASYWGRKRSRWKCRCVCGVIKVLDNHTLKYDSKSCGCKRYEAQRKPDGAPRRILAGYKFSAKRRGLEFSLPLEEFKKLTSSNCYYCGAEPSQSKNVRYRDPYFYNGIDRRDNRLGYTHSNSVPCCRLCNQAKMTMSEDDFLSWVSRIYHHRFTPNPPTSP